LSAWSGGVHSGGRAKQINTDCLLTQEISDCLLTQEISDCLKKYRTLSAWSGGVHSGGRACRLYRTHKFSRNIGLSAWSGGVHSCGRAVILAGLLTRHFQPYKPETNPNPDNLTERKKKQKQSTNVSTVTSQQFTERTCGQLHRYCSQVQSMY